MKKIILFLFVYFTSFNFSYALIEVDITRGNLDPLPIAVSPLHVDIKSEEQENIKIKELALKEKQLSMIKSWMVEKIDETYVNINQDNKDCNFTNKWVKN